MAASALIDTGAIPAPQLRVLPPPHPPCTTSITRLRDQKHSSGSGWEGKYLPSRMFQG
jgi:hypothetical protein